MTTLDNFLSLYRNLNHDSVSKLGSVYTDDVVFIDPITQHRGLPALREYFHRLLPGGSDCAFAVESAYTNGESGHVCWMMTFSHERLNSGRPIRVPGMSQVTLRDGKVCFQRDYFDLGAMLYENIPFLGPVVRMIRGRLAE